MLGWFFTILLWYLSLTPYLKVTSNHAQLFSILLLTFFSKLNIPQRQINSLKNGDKWAPKRVIVLLEASFFFKQKHHIRAEDPSSAESSKTHIFFFQKWELVLLFPHHLFLLKGKLWRWHLNSRYRMGFGSIWWKEQVTLISAHWSVQIFEKSKMKKEYCLSLKYGKAVAKKY